MPPEQACGDVAALDERADVFALGAILCEILTGQPPYVRQPGSNVMEQAQEASLEDAFSRLENCGADRELVDLALRCLQDERDARPRDAGIVAKAIADYLTHAEERTQSAQVATAEARVRATEERKARRLTGALAASIVLLICFTVAIVWSQERDRVEADRQIHSALADARDLSGTDQWPAAQEALRRAELLVDDTRGSDEAHEEVKRFRGRFDQEFEIARIKQADQDLITRLQAIHTQPLSGATEFKSHDYAEALRSYGIDVLDLDAEDSARLIRDKGQSIAAEIAFALDDWTERRLTDRRRWNNETVQTLRKLRTLSSLIDDDEWRQRLRDATGPIHRTTLAEMASSLTPDDRDPRSIGLLATRLRNSHQRDLALTVLRKAFHSYPGDFWINYSLGDALLKSVNRNAWYWRGREIDSDRVDEAMQHIWIAVSHQPGNAFLRYRLANLLQLNDQSDEALIHMSEAVDLAPESTTMRIGLANLMIAQGDIEWARKQLAAAFDTTTDSYLVRRLVQTRLDRRDIRSGVPLPTIIENLRRALDTDREERELHRQLAVALYRTADWDAAAAAAQATLQLDDGDLDTRLLLARVHLRQGDFDEAVKLLSESTRRGDNDPNLKHLSEDAAVYADISRDLEARLHEGTPSDRDSSVRRDQLILARVLQRRGGFARAGQLYAMAWGDRPPSVLSGRSIGGRSGRNSRGSRPVLLRGEPSEVRDGIVSLARAGCGLGEDTDTLGDAARKALRARALAWFERALKELERAVNRRRSDGEAVFTILEGWMYDVRLTCVRDQAWLATFSAEETAAWTAAWAQLAELINRARR